MQKWLHISGIAGKVTSNIALMYRDMGYFVTGSDNNCLPPATDLLDKENIPYVEGYNFRHLTREFWQEKLGKELDIPEIPDRTIFVATLSKENKEYSFAKTRGIKIQTYAQAFGEDLVRQESIVSVGTAGKTTTTALLVHIMSGLGFDPSYMVGAEFADGRPALQKAQSDWSILEGDEYYGINIEQHAKFFEYKPKYVLLGKLIWDHADVYPTEEAYLDTFRRLLREMPKHGLVIANAGDENIRKTAGDANCVIRWYNAYEEIPEFTNVDEKKLYWHLEKSNEAGNEFVAISYEPEPFEFKFRTKLLGKYNQQNILGVVAMLYELFAEQIDWREVAKLIESFPGLQKRLEILKDSPELKVIDDLGGPPLKVMAGLETVRETYPDHNIIAIYEPNSGNRKAESMHHYKDVFAKADVVIIPELSKNDETLLSNEQLIAQTSEISGAKKLIAGGENVTELIRENMSADKPNLVIYFNSYRLTQQAREFAL